MTAAPGWFLDPGTRAYLRWWDGAQWTPYTQPMPVAPAPPGPAPAPTPPPQPQPAQASEGWWARQTARNVESRRLQHELGISSWELAKRQVQEKQAAKAGKELVQPAVRQTQGVAPASKPARTTSGVVSPDRLRVVNRWVLEEQIEVAGETYHIKEIKTVLKLAGRPVTTAGVTLDDIPTFLCPEPSNSFDRNAVMVMVGIYMVGYLPAELAADYSPPLLELARRGEAVGCQSRIWARLEGGMARARVTVLAPEVDELP